MNSEYEIFFEKDKNKRVIRQFIMSLNPNDKAISLLPDIILHLRNFSLYLEKNSKAFDLNCRFNIGAIGGLFLDELHAYPNAVDNERSDLLVRIFVMAYRFVCEFSFSRTDALSPDLRRFIDYVDDNLVKFPPGPQSQLVYASYIMPSNIVKEMLHSPAILDFQSFNKSVQIASGLKKEWDAEIAAKKKEMEDLKGGLSRIKTEYNFVGLVRGFENLASAKRIERSRSFIVLVLLGLLMISPVVAQIIFVGKNINSGTDFFDLHRGSFVYLIPSFIALEVILLYVFRVALIHFRGIDAQMLQINLRISLCQFIQSYSEYSSAIKEKDKNALDKFESLIFSGIVSDGGAIPSTFDGVEQIAKLVNGIRNAK